MKGTLNYLLLFGSSIWLSVAVAADDLLGVYQQAKTHDPQLRIALAQQASRNEARPQALAALQPNITLSGQLDYQKQRLTTGTDNYASHNLTLSLAQPLYRRAAWLALDQVDKQLAQAQLDYQAAEQSLIVRTAQAYFAVLAAQDELSFARREKTAIARQLDQAQQRFAVGLVAMTEVYEAQARFDQAGANQLSAEHALDNAREVLREITGTVPAELVGLGDTMRLQVPEPNSIQAWNEQAQQHNLSIRVADLACAIAQDTIAIRQSAHYPTLDLSATIGRARSQATTSIDSDTSRIGLQLAVPLYQGGGTESKIREAQFLYQVALEQRMQRRRAIDRQVRNAYRGIQTSIARVQALQATQISAQSALDATQAGFEAGTRTLVDVLNSQRDLYRAKRDYAQSRYNYVLNTLLLLQAAGTLSEEDMRRVNTRLGTMQ